MAVAANGKTIATLSEAITHLLSGGAWSGAGQGATLSYSFMATEPATMPEDATGFATFTAAQIHGAELALIAWSDVANLHFSRIGSGDSGSQAFSNDGTLRFSDYTGGVAGSSGFTFLPNTLGNRSASSLQGDGWYNSTFSYNAAPTVFGYGQKTLVHEIGHALGLVHPGDYDGAADGRPTYAAQAEIYQDSQQYSVMSYFDENSTGGNFGAYYASAPQLLDIAAIQQLYGANTSAFLGDTTYGFNATAGRPWFQALSAGSPLIFSVWDAGGVDTFDFTGYGQNQRIDLNAGAFSDVGGMTGNVSIAYGAVIENALGGTGSDTLTGNASANFMIGFDGQDSVFGGAGNDDLNGNRGFDTVDGGDGNDIVRGGQNDDIVLGGAGDDPHVNGNLGNDTVRGGPGSDTVFGGQGDDSLQGEDGADWLSGDLGSDVMSGGPGADRFLIRAGSGADRVLDFNSAEGDRVQIAPGLAYSVTTVAGQAVVQLSSGDTLTLSGVSQAQLGDWLVVA